MKHRTSLWWCQAGIAIALGTLFFPGCIPPPRSKPVAAVPAAQKKDDTQALQEQAQMVELQKAMAQWQERLNALIDSLQFTIAESKSNASTPVSGQAGDGLKGQEDLLKQLKELRVLQFKLNEPDSALSRERLYFRVVDGYLSSLRLCEEMRAMEMGAATSARVKNDQIKRTFDGKDFSALVDLYRRIPEDKVNPMSRAYYALSLARLDRKVEATAFAAAMLDKGLPLTCGDAPLWYEFGEWLSTAGESGLAEKVLTAVTRFSQAQEEWIARAKAKAALLGTKNEFPSAKERINQAITWYDEGKARFSDVYVLCLEARKACLDFRCQEEVESQLSHFTDNVVKDMERTLQRVDQAMEASQFLEAKQILASLLELFPGEDYPLPITDTLTAVREKQRYLQEKERAPYNEMAEQKIKAADELVENENYEEAIANLNQLQGTAYQPEAERKKQNAIDGLVRKKRLKAGQLFLQAKNASDGEVKKNCLVQSYNLLKEITDTYPTNSYAEKIRKNLDDVRGELEKIAPEFFADKAGSESLPPETPRREN